MEIEPTVKFQILREQARNRILDILDSISGPKMLAIDQSLIGPLSVIIEMSAMKEHGVMNVQPVTDSEMVFDFRDVIYIVRPAIQVMKNISLQVKVSKSHREEHRFHLFMCPRASNVCENVLMDREVMGDFEQIDALLIYLIPLEYDLLSMQNDRAFKEVVLDRDFTIYHNIARSVLHLEHLFGPIPLKEAKGTASAHILRILSMLEQDEPEYVTEHPVSEIHQIVFIDRELDMITPICTPMTYEALIDEVFGIANNLIKVSSRLLGKDDIDRMTHITLTSSDSVFQEIRDLNYCVLKGLLTEKLAYIDTTYKDKDNQRTVDELNRYMKRFKQAHKDAASVQNHLHLAIHITNEIFKNPFFTQDLNLEHSIILGDTDNTVFEYIERMIGSDEDLINVLRMLCLMSLVQGGLKPKYFDFFRKEIIQSYGFHHILTLANLEKAGLLKKHESRPTSWANLKKAFRLINEDVNQHQPDDVAYAYAGYAPLTLRLIENLVRPGWTAEPVRSLPGEYHRVVMPSEDTNLTGTKRVVLLFFVGGLTFAEVAAIRYLNKRPDADCEFVMATTNMVNSKTFLSNLGENIFTQLDSSSID